MAGVRYATAVVALAATLTPALSTSPASALQHPGTNCGIVGGALWLSNRGNPTPSFDIATRTKLVGNGWRTFALTPGGASADPSNCPAAASIVANNSPQAGTPGQRTGPDGAVCTFSSPTNGFDKGSGDCVASNLRVIFNPELGPNYTSAPCPRVAAPWPPYASHRLFGHHHWAWIPKTYGVRCAEVRRVTGRAAKHARVYRLIFSRSTAIVSAAGGHRWYCRRNGVAGACADQILVPSFGWARTGPWFEWLLR